MWLRVLGSAAGGGFPQWNCACPNCHAVRGGHRMYSPRTQSSVAVSADYRNWYLLNASPDLRQQIAAFPALHPRQGRDSPLRAVLLTDAELDHTLGLLLLREADELVLHATAAVHDTLRTGTGLLPTLLAYSEVRWHPVEPGTETPLGEDLTYRAFAVPTTKAPRFGTGGEPDRVVGYRITERATGRAAVYAPVVCDPAGVRDQLGDCACLLFDGTCWHDDELIRLGMAAKTSRDMGHVPIDGADGSLAQLAGLPVEHRIYLHINNTNPILLDDSPEHRLLAEHGWQVATDGLEVRI